MYVPEVFRKTDRSQLLAHMVANPFATVLTHDGARLQISHLPLLVSDDGASLFGHMARQNPQCVQLEQAARAVVIFHGPHGYVSPSAYGEGQNVPTWNYVVVHAEGPARLVGQARLEAILEAMVQRYDKTGWRMEGPEEFVREKMDAIVGFEIDIETLEGKWKLSQNRPRSDRVRVAEWLSTGDASSQAAAALVLETLRD